MKAKVCGEDLKKATHNMEKNVDIFLKCILRN